MPTEPEWILWIDPNPMLLKTEHVVLQGNQMTPIELKIFSSQLRESKKGSIVLKKLDISNSNLTDESLQQIAKLAFLVEEIDFHNSNFGEDGVEMLVKCYHKFGSSQDKACPWLCWVCLPPQSVRAQVSNGKRYCCWNRIIVITWMADL